MCCKTHNMAAKGGITLKKLVATASRRECVYKRTGKPSATFYERGKMTEQRTDFLQRKSEESEVHFDERKERIE